MGFRDAMTESPSNAGVASITPEIPAVVARAMRPRLVRKSKRRTLGLKVHTKKTPLSEEKQESDSITVSESSSSLSPLPTTTTRRRRRSRVVRFETDENDEIIPQYRLFRVSRSVRDERLWWTADEVEMMRQGTIVVINSYKENVDYIREFYNVFTLCAQSTWDEGYPDDLPEDVLRSAQTSARGLEIQILSILDRYRAKYVESILLTQDTLAGDRQMDPETRATALSARSMQISRTGRILARVLGDADAAQVIDDIIL
jgi:hypothetical protein